MQAVIITLAVVRLQQLFQLVLALKNVIEFLVLQLPVSVSV